MFVIFSSDYSGLIKTSFSISNKETIINSHIFIIKIQTIISIVKKTNIWYMTAHFYRHLSKHADPKIQGWKEGKFYLMMHLTHFIYGYMASDHR